MSAAFLAPSLIGGGGPGGRGGFISLVLIGSLSCLIGVAGAGFFVGGVA